MSTKRKGRKSKEKSALEKYTKKVFKDFNLFVRLIHGQLVKVQHEQPPTV